VLADGTIAAHSAERKRRHVPLKAAHVTNYTNHCAYRREIGGRCGFDGRFKIDARSPKPFDTAKVRQYRIRVAGFSDSIIAHWQRSKEFSNRIGQKLPGPPYQEWLC